MNTSYTSYAPVISVRNLTKSYGQHTVLRDISLDIYPGESVAVMGPSGSGKTTLLHALSGIIRIDSGTIQVLGGGPEIPGGRVELGALSEKQRTSLRANSFGFIFQQGLLIPELTAEENVSLGAMISGMSRDQARGASANLLARLGLGDMCEKRIGELSGGQAQRVGVARALAADASILLMDEPFSAVDPIVRTELQEELLRLQGELHKTIVFVTHDIDEALFLGDNIAVFAPGGKLAQYGAPEEILTNPANDFVESFVSQSVGALLPADVMRQVRYIRRERYRRTREAAASGEGAASTSGRG